MTVRRMPNVTATHVPRARPGRPVSMTLAVVICAAAIVACGSSAAPHANASSHYPQFLKFSQCMRSHGVPNFPDPSSGGGIQINSSSGINPFSPAFKAAHATCRKLLPGGGPGGHGPASAQAKQQLLAISRCMRTHGVTNFPDPTTTPPSGPDAFREVIGHDGVFLVIPNTIDTASPTYMTAARTCGFERG